MSLHHNPFKHPPTIDMWLQMLENLIIKRHSKYNTEEERKEAVKQQKKIQRLRAKEKRNMRNLELGLPPIRTLHPKYETEEERKEARNKQAKKYRSTDESKIKRKKLRKEWGLKNKIKVYEDNKKWRLNNRDIVKINNNKYYSNNKQEHLEKCDIRRRIKINKAMNILGGAICKHCGNTDFRVLQFDHIHGGGRKDETKCNDLLNEIIENPETSNLKYQILCANCNSTKRKNNHECYKITNPTQEQLHARIKGIKVMFKLRNQAMIALGGVICNNKECKKTDIDCLQIDHIHGGGTKEGTCMRDICIKIRDDPSCRSEYQVLCANCNTIKRLINGECKKLFRKQSGESSL